MLDKRPDCFPEPARIFLKKDSCVSEVSFLFDGTPTELAYLKNLITSAGEKIVAHREYEKQVGVFAEAQMALEKARMDRDKIFTVLTQFAPSCDHP